MSLYRRLGSKISNPLAGMATAAPAAAMAGPAAALAAPAAAAAAVPATANAAYTAPKPSADAPAASGPSDGGKGLPKVEPPKANNQPSGKDQLKGDAAGAAPSGKKQWKGDAAGAAPSGKKPFVGNSSGKPTLDLMNEISAIGPNSVKPDGSQAPALGGFNAPWNMMNAARSGAGLLGPDASGQGVKPQVSAQPEPVGPQGDEAPPTPSRRSTPRRVGRTRTVRPGSGFENGFSAPLPANMASQASARPALAGVGALGGPAGLMAGMAGGALGSQRFPE